jgi:GNAT superfamily N-acetyltransferase
MQDFNIIKTHEIKNISYRVAKIRDQFDYTKNSVEENFKGTIKLPEIWNIGLIVGKRGTGKSTIAKELFREAMTDYQYSAECVIDDFDNNIKEIDLTKMLSTVGFSNIPSWFKPYSVLSNGEKMRVDLARALLDSKEIILFDEYTSVVDREVAKMGALATYNALKKTNKKFIAVSCHFDIMEWLQPDWIFSTDTMQMIDRGLLRRPKIKIEIKKTTGYWNIFRRYHYLSHDLNKSCHQFVAFYNNNPIAFCAVINFPHSQIKPMRKIHRIVVLPDYQGIGIGVKLLNFIASQYYDKGEYIGITTSLNSFAKSIMHDKKWKICHLGRMSKNNCGGLNKTISSNRNTYSFKYIGN